MSIRLARLSIGKGESIQIGFEGSVEKSVIVGIDKEGNAFVSGPMNANMRTVIVTEEELRVDGRPEAGDRSGERG